MKLKLIFTITALLAIVACQDSFNFPDKLLADVNPGPDSSLPGTWYHTGDKAYTTVTITGKTFKQILVSDGTTEGTKLVGEINTSQRGDPFVKNPFWTASNDYSMKFAVFDEKIWLMMYNYDTERYEVFTINPAEDVLRKYIGGIVKSVDVGSTTDYLNIRNVKIFKGEYFAFNPNPLEQGLYFFDKGFTTSYAINNASNFRIEADLYDPYFGFDDSSSTFLLTEDFLIIEGRVGNHGGLWAYDGTTVWPLNLGTSTFHDSLKAYDSVNKKLYYVAFFNELPQVVVNDLNDLGSNYTILTNLDQECFPVYDCFSYLGVMDEQKGTVAFSYNTQLGFTNGTLSGTTFFVGNPRAQSVFGAYQKKLYFREWISSLDGGLMVTDGTLAGTKKVLEQVVSLFIPINGNVLMDTGLGMYSMDPTGTVTFIRDISVSSVWTRVTLPNNRQQLYTYYKSRRSCGRGCTRRTLTLQVSDGTGIVSFSGNFAKDEVMQPVFLNNRFLMSATSETTGIEVFYMDMAPESYITPPPVPDSPLSAPGSVTSDTPRSTAACFYLLMLIAVLFNPLV